MLRSSRLPVIVLVTMLLSAAAGYAAHASTPSALLAAGTTRYAVVSASNGVGTSSVTFVDIPNTTVWITVPQGQTADVMFEFCGTMVTGLGGSFQIQGMIGSVLAAPGPYTAQGELAPSQTRCVQFYKTGITAGNKAVKVQWKIPGNGTGAASVYERSVIVTVNTH